MSINKVDYKYQISSNMEFQTPVFGYDIDEDYYSLDSLGKLMLKKGYAWNGATLAIDTESFKRPSAVHDALYQMIKTKAIPASKRIVADKLLKTMCRKAGMSAFRAQYVYLAVRAFGSIFAGDK